MRTSRALVFVVGLFLSTLPLFAQGVEANCDLNGTWYGGSDPIFQYMFNFTPVGGGRYNATAQYGFDNHPFGYVTWSDWKGQAIKTGPKTYETYEMSYWIWDPAAAAAAGVDPSLPEVDIVHSLVKMVDCDTFTATVDIYAGYFSFTPERKPFIDPVDVNWLEILYPGVTLVETYHRLPSSTKFGLASPEAKSSFLLDLATKSKKR